MRKTKRHSSIVNILTNSNEIITAEALAQNFSVSTRTIYRDITALITAGIPIIGEAGIGYSLGHNQDTIPAMFTTQELEALTLGAHMIKHWSNGTFKDSAITAIEKINTASPHIANNNIEDTTLFYPPSKNQGTIEIDIPTLRRALNTKHKIEFDYPDQNEGTNPHTLNPLCIAFFGPSWLLVGWCETSHRFQNFKLEQMQNLAISTEKFENSTGTTLEDFIARMQNKPATETTSEPLPAPTENTAPPHARHAGSAL